MGTGKFKPWRRLAVLAQAAVLLGLPFITVNGRSALRFDVPSLSLHFFGTSIAIDEFFLLASALLFLLFLFIAITMLFGRIWCGWACPQTVLSDITRSMETSRGAVKVVWVLMAAGLSMVVSADILWYFVPPQEFIGMLRESPVVSWSFAVLSLLLFMDIVFVRQIFCRTVCPYARLQNVLFDDRTVLIAYDPSREDECMGCSACSRACPVGIDIREGLDMACISCAECIDACAEVRGKKEKDSLVGYFRGGPGRIPVRLLTSPLRVNVILAFLLSAVFLIILLNGSFTREDFAASIRLNPDFKVPELHGVNRVNSYILSIRNRSSEEALYETRSDTLRITTRDEMRLAPGGAGRFVIYATPKGEDMNFDGKKIKIEVLERGSGETSVLEADFPGG